MKIQQNALVSLKYELRFADNTSEIVESNDDLRFVFGRGRMLASFEQQLEGLEAGNNFGFTLEAKDAYGDFNPEALVPVPIDTFRGADGNLRDDLLHTGRMIPMMDDEGNRLNGIIVQIGDSEVLIDFNHPLSGKDLVFSGSINEVREATEDELNPKHHCGGCGGGGCHGEGGCGGHHHEEGHECNCGGDGGGCGCHDEGHECTCTEEEGCGCGGHCHD